MLEIRFHGRGGQGTVVASIILAKAFFKAGYCVQTFPVFGVERRGAPVEAYLRIDERKIRVRCNVYTPDHVVVQDAKLLRNANITAGLKPGGWVVLNHPGAPDNGNIFSEFRLAVIDASRIAIENRLGTRTQPIINTAMVGACAKVLGIPGPDEIEAAIRQEISVKPGENIQAAKQAYEQVKII